MDEIRQSAAPPAPPSGGITSLNPPTRKSLLRVLAGGFLLVIVLIPGIGKVINGSRRWLSLGFMTMQPSELMKLFAVFLSTAKAQTMPIMVAAKNAGEKGILWWEMCAIIVVMIIPVIIMAIFLQRFIARGVLLGAVKG